MAAACGSKRDATPAGSRRNSPPSRSRASPRDDASRCGSRSTCVSPPPNRHPRRASPAGNSIASRPAHPSSKPKPPAAPTACPATRASTSIDSRPSSDRSSISARSSSPEPERRSSPSLATSNFVRLAAQQPGPRSQPAGRPTRGAARGGTRTRLQGAAVGRRPRRTAAALGKGHADRRRGSPRRRAPTGARAGRPGVRGSPRG